MLRENRQGEVFRKNIVLFEDFVGSGSQMLDAVHLAASLGNDVNVLLCPIFICPEGAAAAEELSRAVENFTFSPVLALEERFFVSPAQKANENPDYDRVRQLLVKIHHKIEGEQQEYGPFGYRQTGGFVVPYTNCPDNTVPALHRKKDDSWEPLFLRTSRLPI
ncbi:hypothetical protein RA27_17370 [Ruegeria sp. ANG-R]|uniref:phosphoribosyltransferase-like protein n=1 Tax=Ruegeria sp. ANG-R TaxID=1577903 RepID=UPI00057FF727|nr:hypothetical protein [Ruegeria sp. ANG-R]KIC39820.1 hypothetical protein RA27_17370 [Ruegeria sp. ANG-R]